MFDRTIDEEVSLGSFDVVSGSLMVSDPCYEKGTWCQGLLDNVRNGKWNALVTKSKEGSWGNRCSSLVVEHEKVDHRSIVSTEWNKGKFEVGVDSGQAGFFDISTYKNGKLIEKDPTFDAVCADDEDENENRWYNACCDITLGSMNAGVLPGGVVSGSGFGDGGYDCMYAMKDGEVVAAMIVFIAGEEEEEEEDSANEN